MTDLSVMVVLSRTLYSREGGGALFPQRLAHDHSSGGELLKKETNAGSETNPVARFAQAARRVWKSDLSVAEKRDRLRGLRDAIDHYADRVERRRLSVKSEETARSFERVRDLLRKMSTDVGKMHLACDATKAKRAA